LTVTLAASAAGAFLAAGIMIRVRRWRRRSPEEIERLRRLSVNAGGRITAGEITDIIEPEAGKPGSQLVAYKYDINSVTYEAAQDMTALPVILADIKRRVGRIVSIKYDPRLPTNSILACEEWSGVPETEARPLNGARTHESPSVPARKS
jgi:hypothetical protein